MPRLKYSEVVNTTDALARAAAAQGIEPEYIDIWGRRHETSEEVSRAILNALGFPAGGRAGSSVESPFEGPFESNDELEQSIEERAAAEWSRPFDPVLVVREDAGSIPLRIPEERSGASVKLEIRWENGRTSRIIGFGSLNCPPSTSAPWAAANFWLNASRFPARCGWAITRFKSIG